MTKLCAFRKVTLERSLSLTRVSLLSSSSSHLSASLFSCSLSRIWWLITTTQYALVKAKWYNLSTGATTSILATWRLRRLQLTLNVFSTTYRWVDSLVQLTADLFSKICFITIFCRFAGDFQLLDNFQYVRSNSTVRSESLSSISISFKLVKFYGISLL